MLFISSSERVLTTFAGLPIMSEFGGNVLFGGTREPAAMIVFSEITVLSRIIAPIPTRTLFWIVHPCRVALCPMVT